MKVRSKKVLSAVVVSAILAAQTLMPVAAAGGTIESTVTTTSPVLRVNVPTKLAVSVNEFEKGDKGSQITSGEFTMKNLSEIPVKVSVSSEAVLGTNTVLVSTKAATKETPTDATKYEMWLAAVAAVKDNSGKLEYATGDKTTVEGLEGTEGNITVFETKDSKSTASQDFYLAAAENSSYKALSKEDTKKEGVAATATIGGADFYALTLASATTAADVAALAATQDLYMSAAEPTDGTAVSLTKIVKGTVEGDITTAGFTATSKIYTVATTPTAYDDLNTAALPHMYIDNATAKAGDAAAFRYIGALSTAKSGWSAAQNLSKVNIAYTIVGISDTAYTDVAGDDGKGLTYGYKAESSQISLSDGVLTIKGISLNDIENITFTVDDAEVVLSAKNGSWNAADAADAVFTFNSSWKEGLKGTTCVITVNDTITATIEVPAA